MNKGSLTIVLRNISRRKSFTFTIFFLSLLSSTFLLLGFGLSVRLSTLFENSYKNSREAEISFGFLAADYQDVFLTYFQNQNAVENGYEENGLLGNETVEKDNFSTVFIPFNPAKKNYKFLNQVAGKLEKNEIYVPLNFKTDYHFKVGQKIELAGSTFTIKNFFEDPIYGSNLYHTKRFFVSDETYKNLQNKSTENNLQQIKFLNIELKKENIGYKLKDTINQLMNDFDENTIYTFDQISVMNLRTMIPKIILIILVTFSIFLLLIMMIVIRYALLSAIEDDYSSLGIMKAIGFKSGQITRLLFSQYLSIVFVGLAFGILIALQAAPYIGRLLLNISGILWYGNIDASVCLIVSGLYVVLVLLVIYPQARKASKIKPVEAIVDGRSQEVHYSKWINLSSRILERIPINIRMTIKQLRTNWKQYVSLFILTIIFSFMNLTMLGLSETFSSKDRVSSLLGYDLIDIKLEINANQQDGEQEINFLIDKINSEYKIIYESVYDTRTKVYLGDYRIQLLVYSEFQTSNLISGRIPEKSDEMIISSGIQQALDLSLGDTVELSLKQNGEDKAFKIVGVNNQVFTLGKNLSMLQSSYEELNPSYKPTEFLLKMENNEHVEDKIKKIESNYLSENSSITVVNERDKISKQISAIQRVLYGISLVVLLLSFVLIFLITVLVSLVIVKRETMNLGIMKSIGFSSNQIQLQFILRFLIISLVGAIVGVSIYYLSDDWLTTQLFEIIGIAGGSSDTDGWTICFVIGFISLTAVLSSAIVSYRIRKINPKILMRE